MLTYFTLEGYITSKQEELGIAAEQKSELDAVKMIYEMSYTHYASKEREREQ